MVDIYPQESVQSIVQAVQSVFSQSTTQYKANNPVWYFNHMLTVRWKLDESALLVLGRIKEELLAMKDVNFDLREIFEHIIPRAITQSRILILFLI